MSKFVNVRTEAGEQRIAGVSRTGQWFSISAGIASLEGRGHSENPVGNQCDGGDWFAGQTLTDEVTGQVYTHQNPECRCARLGIHKESFCGLCG